MMLGSTSLLKACARLIADVGEYAAVTLYLPAVEGEVPSPPVLVHSGEAAAVPELADSVAAEGAVAELDRSSVSRDEIVRHPSRRAPGLLLRVPTRSERPALVAGETRSDLPPLWVGLLGGSSYEQNALWRLAGDLARHLLQVLPILVDSTTSVPGRAQFQVYLSQALRAATANQRPLALLLVNPDDFEGVNERLGRAGGDAVMVEVADRLQASRWPVFRYGAAVFAVLVPETEGAPEDLAQDLLRRLTAHPYGEAGVRLTFSLGLAVVDSAADDRRDAGLTLLLRADEALSQATAAGGDRLVQWQAIDEGEAVERRDRLSGIFTADVGRDYRNMLLLWDMVSVVTRFAEEDDLAARVLDKLSAAFRPLRIDYLEMAGEAGELRPIASLAEPPIEGRQLARRALEAQRSLSEEGLHAFPLIARQKVFGCLLVRGEESAPELDSADAVLLEAMASHLAAALDRAALARQERSRREQESRHLRAELSELRHALQQSKLLHRSPAMEKVLSMARRVAPSDATVLITGESGTGKEMLARTLHQLSERRDLPCVVVDCGAIAASLIDSELFGHERGAFTGADQRSPGRLAQAEGGTVILDEVGELPLEVQSKLLRFVQEKQLTPVGATQPMMVDVRIVAVTNRELLSEVQAGRFREDLYFRLNVVRLEVPPLRQRRDDILFLGRHFAKKFAFQYDKALRGLSPAAERRLLEHDWPGNVRELQNRLMQAVLLSETDRVEERDLQIEAPPALAVAGDGTVADSPLEATEERLRACLRGLVAEAVGDSTVRAMPMGRWLEEDLILAADRLSEGAILAGSRRVGIPESTYRRRLKRVSAASEAGLLPRAEAWQEIRALLPDWLSEGKVAGDRLRSLRRMLLALVVEHFPHSTGDAAGLMGVSEPTYRRWKESELPSAGIH
ncbi:MAG: sigma 54-interacting transcriptional regulator [Acidobacteriota bacterium]